MCRLRKSGSQKKKLMKSWQARGLPFVNLGLMKMDDKKNTCDRRVLKSYELEILDTQILPTALRWTKEYEPGTTLYEHGMQTLGKWGAL